MLTYALVIIVCAAFGSYLALLVRRKAYARLLGESPGKMRFLLVGALFYLLYYWVYRAYFFDCVMGDFSCSADTLFTARIAYGLTPIIAVIACGWSRRGRVMSFGINLVALAMPLFVYAFVQGIVNAIENA